MTSVSSPKWTDDELLAELRDALQDEAVDDAVIRAAASDNFSRSVLRGLNEMSLHGLSTDTLAALSCSSACSRRRHPSCPACSLTNRPGM
jgi:ADP-ribosylglycohydrolase